MDDWMEDVIAGIPLWQGINAAPEAFTAALSPEAKQTRWTNIRSYIGAPEDTDPVTFRCSLANISQDDLTRVLEHAPSEADPLNFLPPFLHLRHIPQSELPALYKEVPFAGIMAATVRDAVRLLQKRLSKSERAIMTPSFIEDLAFGLLEELCLLSHHALLGRFNAFVTSSRHAGEARLSRLSGKGDSSAYDDFLATLAADKGKRFFTDNPVILRLLRIRLEYWLKNSAYLIKSLYRDRLLVERELGMAPFQQVERLWPLRSDSHHEGKTVCIVQTDQGEKIVFKPRSLALELGFMRILSHLNQTAGTALFRIMRMLDRKTHGWCEYIEHSESSHPEDVEMFYYRTGLLTAVLHAFRATDCHFENLIASRNYPVMVDLETLFHPDPVISAKHSAIRKDRAELLGSVTRIGILPDAQGLNEEGDLTALGAGLESQSFVRRRYVHVGSSLMALKDDSITLESPPSRPTAEALSRDALVAQIKRGFHDGYHLLLRERDTILTSRELLPSLKAAKCRYVARPTRAYAWLLQRSIDGSVTHSGIDSSLEFERLYRMCLDEEYRQQWYSIAESERHALEHLDIPHFSVSLSERALYSGTHKIVPAWFPCSPLTAVKRRIQELSTADCQHQLRIIDLSFAQRDPSDKPPRQVKTTTQPSPTPEAKIIDVASQIARQIQATSYRTQRGSLDWATLGFLPQPGLYRIESCGKGLYRGHSGIGLFFATLFAVSDDPQHADFARSILQGCYNLHSKDDPIDVGDGVAGTSYALYTAGRLMNDPTLRTSAYKLVTGLNSQRITSAEHIDFMAGGAGVLLVAELLSREFQTPMLERLMREIAEELLRREISVGHGVSAWKTLDEQCLPGFAHGSSGIAYALARAGVRLAESRYLEAAQRGFKNEANLFDESIGNWRDLRAASRDNPLSLSWCHGATGIGLAALAAETLLGSNSRHTMTRALRVVERELNDEIPSLDCVCCGATGSLELLLRCRESGQHNQLLLSLSSDLSERTQYHYLPRNASAPFLPGLFLGAAGVGYQLLRTTFPEKVPALLLLE